MILQLLNNSHTILAKSAPLKPVFKLVRFFMEACIMTSETLGIPIKPCKLVCQVVFLWGCCEVTVWVLLVHLHPYCHTVQTACVRDSISRT